MARWFGRVVLVAGLAACKAPPEAPGDLEDLSRYLFREWDAEDPAVMEAGVANLDELLGDLDLTGNVNDRSFQIGPLDEEDVVAIDRPEDRDLDDCLGVAVARESPWSVEDHARLQSEADQSEWESSAPDYERVFTRGGECFADGTCEVMETVNHVTRSNALLRVPFVLCKNFRWVELEDGRQAIAARSWFERSWPGESGNTMLWQSYAVDLWIGQPGGETWRYQALWSESDVGISGDNLIVGTLKAGTEAIFQAGDDAIEDMYH